MTRRWMGLNYIACDEGCCVAIGAVLDDVCKGYGVCWKTGMMGSLLGDEGRFNKWVL